MGMMENMDIGTVSGMTSGMYENKNHHKKEVGEDSDSMNLTDIRRKFEEDFIDEIEDSNAYCDMATVAEHGGHERLAEGLYAMAYDEFTHASFIHDNLVDWGCSISEKDMMLWHELKERIHRKFRDRI